MAIGKGGVNKKTSKADLKDKPTNPYLEDITIRKELNEFIPERTEAEVKLLLEDIRKYKQKDPAIVTLIDGEIVLVDGHGRYEALQQLGTSRIKVVYRDDLTTDEEIKLYMAKVQLGRRNISDQVKSKLRGEYWLKVTEDKEKGYDVATRKEVAKALGVAESTLKKDAVHAKSCKTILDAIPEAKNFIENSTTPKTVVKKIADIVGVDIAKAKRMIVEVSPEGSKDKKAAKVKEITNKKPKSDRGMSNIKVETKLVNKLKEMAKEKGGNHTISDVIEDLISHGK